MTSLAAALSEPATSALELYCVPSAWLAKPTPISSDEPGADHRLSAPRGEDRDAAEQG